MKNVGIITFHNSYNCGSMLESYAMQTIIEKRGGHAEIINFSNEGQRDLYNVFSKNKDIKSILKNILIFPVRNKVKFNNKKYEEFKNNNFKLSEEYSTMSDIKEKKYDVVVAGSDQIWNITIQDNDDAYFLPWVKKAKKVAYAPSFGAKNIIKYADDVTKYKKMLNNFDALSVRENNGKKWIKELCGKDVEVLLDPTLLLEKKDYDKIKLKRLSIKEKYIFFYCPSFNRDICKFVKKISEKYGLKVITWSTKSYNYKRVKNFGFDLADYEDPSMYLSLIENAELVITTSFHGTIFSTIYHKKFIVVKNGDMYGTDDRVITLITQLGLEDRLLPYDFDDDYNYFCDVDYKKYEKKLPILKKKAIDFIDKNVIGD